MMKYNFNFSNSICFLKTSFGNLRKKEFVNFSKFNFSRFDTLTNEDVKKRLAAKWEKKHGFKGIPNFFSSKDNETVKFFI